MIWLAAALIVLSMGAWMQGVMGHALFIRQLGIIIGRARFQALYIQVISQNVLRIFIDSRHILGIYYLGIV